MDVWIEKENAKIKNNKQQTHDKKRFPVDR